MAASTLDRFLTTLSVDLHAASVCLVQRGWQLAFGPFRAVTVHHVLQGSGVVRVGDGGWQRFAAPGIIVVPAHQPHVLGEAGPSPQVIRAEDRCAMIADGLVSFIAGDGSADTLLVCGAMPVLHGGPPGLLDLLREPVIEDLAGDPIIAGAFGLMGAEAARPGFGTHAMLETLMKQCLLVLLRRHLARLGGVASPVFACLQHPRLARAVLAVVDQPAAPHSVESLAAQAGMSRASFAEHFSRAYGHGPMDFVQKTRLYVAARLLTTTDLPVKVVAQSVGYAGPTSLSRAFRNSYGADPSTYRRTGAPAAWHTGSVAGAEPNGHAGAGRQGLDTPIPLAPGL